MSNDDRNKTVFRPSPLQQRGSGGPVAAPGGQPPPASSEGGGWGAPPQPPMQQPGPAGDPFAAMPLPGGAPQAPAVAPAVRSANFSDSVPQPPTPRQDRNPMMAAAEPVLMVAAALQSGRWHVPLPEFHARATELIGTFDQTIQPLYPEPVRQRAKYAVCATIDDIAQNLPGTPDGGTGWAQRNMVVTFFRENIGGDRFWDFVQEMLRDPAQNRDMIELFHACLAAGFEGRTRAMPDGGRKKQEVMASLLAGLDHVRSLSQQELVDHWRGEDRPRRPNNFWSLITTAAAAAAAIMFLVFTAFYLVLMVSGQEPERQVAALFPSEPVALNRAATEMPVPAVPAEMRLRQFLAAEIEQGLVEVQGNRIRTTIGTLFAPASDQLVDGRRPLFDKIGKAIELEKGPVTVEGHADSDRISGSIRFPNNIALSEARAQTVAGIIGASLSDKGRVKAVGLGDTVPLASNDTADGKARNRRVEIVLDNGF